MRYLHILLACAAEPWAMDQRKLQAVYQFLAFKAQGGSYSQEELAARLDKRTENAVARRDGVVAIIPVMGVMMQRVGLLEDISGGISTESLAAQFRAAVNDPEVKAIIFDIDSPGGSTFGTQELADEVFESRGDKPIIAQVNSYAASAAYWLAAQADEIVITPGGEAGSIGVYCLHEDISKLLEMEGIQETFIASHPYKVEGNEFEPLSEDAREFIQQRVDLKAKLFVEQVARGRGIEAGEISERFGQGRCFTAQEALRRGMVDRIDALPATITRFTGQTFNPARTSAQLRGQRALALASLREKIMAGGDPPSARDWERGLRDAGFTKSEAERAVALYLKGQAAQGDPESKTAADTEEVSKALGGLKQALSRFELPQL